ncbi:MAG: hypothetical protein C0597_04010 [Marinilabiliales bacterium]|nr:MAG: hypothetical protein C0597_04010 [Marinilabiliales bacterium]
MKKIVSILAVAALLLALSSCEENNDPKIIEGEVEIFLLKSFETMDNTVQINENSIVTEDTPLVNYGDIISYDKNNYAFLLTESAKQNILDRDDSMIQSAFAVTANGVLVYTGYFWPSYLSSICNWIVMDPLFIDSGNRLYVKLGYPDHIVGESIPDKRNDNMILDIFKRDDKLID